MHVALARARGATVLGGAAVTRDRAAAPTACELDHRGRRVRGRAGRRSARARGRAGCCRALGVDWPIRLTQEQVTYYATPNLPTSRRTASRSGSGTATATTSTTASPSTARWRRRRRRTSAGRRRASRTARGGPDAGAGAAGRAASLESDPPRLHRARALHALLPVRHAARPRLRRRLRARASRGSRSASARATRRSSPALLGRILAELAIDGATAFPIEAFRADRPALADPGLRRPATGSGGVAAAT